MQFVERAQISLYIEEADGAIYHFDRSCRIDLPEDIIEQDEKGDSVNNYAIEKVACDVFGDFSGFKPERSDEKDGSKIVLSGGLVASCRMVCDKINDREIRDEDGVIRMERLHTFCFLIRDAENPKISITCAEFAAMIPDTGIVGWTETDHKISEYLFI